MQNIIMLYVQLKALCWWHDALHILLHVLASEGVLPTVNEVKESIFIFLIIIQPRHQNS